MFRITSYKITSNYFQVWRFRYFCRIAIPVRHSRAGGNPVVPISSPDYNCHLDRGDISLRYSLRFLASHRNDNQGLFTRREIFLREMLLDSRLRGNDVASHNWQHSHKPGESFEAVADNEKHFDVILREATDTHLDVILI
jgi:hypothetical protein